jgi:hypothetical protein
MIEFKFIAFHLSFVGSIKMEAVAAARLQEFSTDLLRVYYGKRVI